MRAALTPPVVRQVVPWRSPTLRAYPTNADDSAVSDQQGNANQEQDPRGDTCSTSRILRADARGRQEPQTSRTHKRLRHHEQKHPHAGENGTEDHRSRVPANTVSAATRRAPR